MERRAALAATCTVIVALVAAGAPVAAHHSAAGIDRTQSKTVSGTVKEFRWGNPHAWIDLDVANDKGVVKFRQGRGQAALKFTPAHAERMTTRAPPAL